MQRVIEIHVKLNKEDKGEGGGTGLEVRASDSEARIRVLLLTRVTMFTLMQSYKRTPNIFYASSSKSKNQSCILSIFIN